MHNNEPSNTENSLSDEVSEVSLVTERNRQVGLYLIGGLMLVDSITVWVSMSIGFWLKFEGPFRSVGLPVSDSLSYFSYMPQFILANALLVGLQFYSHRYSREGLMASAFCAVQSAITWGILLGFTSLLLKVEPAISRIFIFSSTIVLILLLGLSRYFYKRFIQNHFAKIVQRSAILVGWNERAEEMVHRSRQSGDFFPLRILAAAGVPDTAELPDSVQRISKEGLELDELLRMHSCDQVIVAGDSVDNAAKYYLQRICAREMVEYSVIPDKLDALSRCLHIESVQGMPLLTQTKRPLDRLENSLLKRAMDILGALAGLLISAPVIAIFCLLVYRESPGPVFYHQTRSGRHGRPFRIIKIRSMRLDAEATTGALWCVEEDSRRLKIGAFMRRMNIDELPQFWNVLTGEMSLVGPRPERPELIHNFKDEINFYNLRHIVKPGITGWAQVNGWRGDTCLKSRIACDLEYIERANFWFDLQIILKTVGSYKNAY